MSVHSLECTSHSTIARASSSSIPAPASASAALLPPGHRHAEVCAACNTDTAADVRL